MENHEKNKRITTGINKTLKIPYIWYIGAKIFFDTKEKKLPHNWCSPCSVFLNLFNMYFTKLLSIFSCGHRNPTVGRILKISFSMVFVIFLYKKTPKIRKKDIFKIPSTVGLQYPQLKNDNSVVTYMMSKFKNTEQGL